METSQAENYNFGVVRWFVIAAIIYLILGALAGTYMAAQLAWPILNFDIVAITFGRLRPLHTHAVIYAFGGCVLMAAAYYSAQLTCKVRLWSNALGWVTFWGWSLIMIYIVTGMHHGPLHTIREYVALKLQIELATAAVWIAFGLNFAMTIATRKPGKVHASNWFLMGMIVMTACLELVNGTPHSVTPADTYAPFTRTIGAEGNHSTITFFLSVGFLGALYYFLPQQIGRSIYSNTLAFIHFGVLMIACVWLGMHYQNLIPLPDWTGSLGGAVSKAILLSVLIAVINGVMTLSGNWEKLRTDYILRFLFLSLVFYAISNIRNPVAYLIDITDELARYIDWTVDSPHSGALGWIAMLSCGALYHMIEKLWHTRMHSARLVNLHFWLFCIGAIIYTSSMYIAGIMQSQMWGTHDEYGNLAYTFAESVEAMHPYYIMRFIGGALVCAGVIVMLYNTIMTIRQTAGRLGDNSESTHAP